MFEFLNQPLITLSEGNFITWGQIILALFLAVFAWVISKFIARKLLGSILDKSGMNKDSVAFIQKIIFFVLLLMVVVIILSLLKIPLTAFAFISGGVAIGFGFGAKTIIENFLSGWILMSERPIRMGDVVEINGNYGSIIEIGNRSTIIKRNDGAHMAIPNNQILESNIINLSIKDPNIRTIVRVGVGYGSDVTLVKNLLLEIAEAHALVRKNPEPKVIFEDFGDNALIFELFFWVSIQSGRELREVRSEIRFKISEVFAHNNLVIAYPQRDVHLYLKNEDSKALIEGQDT